MTSNNQDRFAEGTPASARAAPAVRSLAKKLGVDLEKCVGTGRDGMITMNDVIARTNQAGRTRREPENVAQSRPNQPGRRPGPEPVREQAPAPQPSRPASPTRGWTNEPQQSQAAVPTSSNVPRDPVRIPPRMQPQAPAEAQAWGTVEEEELATEQPEPRIVASRLQDLSSYDFPSAERQPDASENDSNAPTSWFATTETTGYQATMVPVQPDPVPAQSQSLNSPINPWGAVEDADERDEATGDRAGYPSEYETEADALQADDGSQGAEQTEEYIELAIDELEASPSAEEADQAAESDWEEPLDAGSELADDSSQYAQDFEPEAQDAAVMTTAYEASASSAAVQSDLTSEEWGPTAPTAAPEVPTDWGQPGVPGYANTASTGAKARTTSLRAPNLDITPPRPLVDQEDRLHGLRRNMALNTTRARDEVATCTMFDDADLNEWPNFADITVRLLRAIAAGIHAEPGFNATFDPAGPSRRLLRQINVAIAVDTREGLTMPVLRDIGSRSTEDLREYVYYMKERTRTRTLAPEDLRDFSFTLANYGIFAGRYATPLVMPPTVATLGCGRLERAVVAGESAPEIHTLLPLSLTFDHRCVTMGEACRFLAALKQDLELAQ